jgi:hypothetical protein
MVLTQTHLLLVDPLTMSTQGTHALPSGTLGISWQLAVTNDGLVIVSDLSMAFSLRAQQFVSVPFSDEAGRAPTASRDGSRVLFAFNSGPSLDSKPVHYYDASTGAIVSSSIQSQDALASYDRHGTVALAAGQVLEANLALRGSVPDSFGAQLSPDGARVYVPDFTPASVHVWDVTATPFTQLPDIPIPGVANDQPARLMLDPHGHALFYVTEQNFVVVALP